MNDNVTPVLVRVSGQKLETACSSCQHPPSQLGSSILNASSGLSPLRHDLATLILNTSTYLHLCPETFRGSPGWMLWGEHLCMHIPSSQCGGF